MGYTSPQPKVPQSHICAKNEHRVPQTSELTANQEAGLMELWSLGAKMTRMVLALRLLQVLQGEGLGTGEINCMAKKRRIQREIKCGNYNRLGELNLEGDKDHIHKLLGIKISETKEDYERARDQF